MEKVFDAIVIGGGHAGAEAAHALSVLGKKTLMLSMSLDAISFMACNPNIGGTAKGHLVREIDALGGLMGEIADGASIQVRMLNTSNGAAVHSLRMQVDKYLYHRLMKKRLERTENLTVMQDEAVELLTDGNGICGVLTAIGNSYKAKAVVVATGVYLNAKIIIGGYSKESGPNGLQRSSKLTESLLKLGLPVRRFKTGTPPRVLARSVDFSKMDIQNGDLGIPGYSFMTKGEVRNDYVCYLTYTSGDTHKLILDNLDKAPLYNGGIAGTGPRYCPSIEDKVVRFKDKERHQIFIEPEGADTEEMYVQGLSTSLPHDIQEKMLKTISGLENAEITRYGYAIEYDCLDPTALQPGLNVKNFKGLFTAGQINGSSGYEEAAAQGLTAGLNAAKYLDGKEPYIFRRDEAYIGVLIDDLVTKGTNEPYRMMTSRAEYRLYLRQDNADIRLTETGRRLGLVRDDRYAAYLERLSLIERTKAKLSASYSPDAVRELCEKAGETVPESGISAESLLRRNGVSAEDLKQFLEDFRGADLNILKYLETEIKYEGYLAKQKRAISEAARMEGKKLPPDLDYANTEGLRLEARQKLAKVRPVTLAQAARISGISPADITVLIIQLKKLGY